MSTPLPVRFAVAVWTDPKTGEPRAYGEGSSVADASTLKGWAQEALDGLGGVPDEVQWRWVEAGVTPPTPPEEPASTGQEVLEVVAAARALLDAAEDAVDLSISSSYGVQKEALGIWGERLERALQALQPPPPPTARTEWYSRFLAKLRFKPDAVRRLADVNTCYGLERLALQLLATPPADAADPAVPVRAVEFDVALGVKLRFLLNLALEPLHAQVGDQDVFNRDDLVKIIVERSKNYSHMRDIYLRHVIAPLRGDVRDRLESP